MINKNKFVFVLCMFIVILFSTSVISAIGCESSGWKGFAKLNENKTVCVTCPTCDFINISTTDPNGNILFQNQPMNESNSEFCYTYNGTQNNLLGTYEINGYSQLTEPLGLCFDTTFSGKENNIGAYIISLLLVISLFLGIVWLSNKYDPEKRKVLYKRLVLGFFKARKRESKTDFARMILYLIGYGFLEMLFVLYYLVVMLFLFLFKDLAVSFGLNTFSLLMPQLIIISLSGLIIIGVFLTLKLYTIVATLLKDINDSMRGIYE